MDYYEGLYGLWTIMKGCYGYGPLCRVAVGMDHRKGFDGLWTIRKGFDGLWTVIKGCIGYVLLRSL